MHKLYIAAGTGGTEEELLGYRPEPSVNTRTELQLGGRNFEGARLLITASPVARNLLTGFLLERLKHLGSNQNKCLHRSRCVVYVY
jgi:hypothetical protein